MATYNLQLVRCGTSVVKDWCASTNDYVGQDSNYDSGGDSWFKKKTNVTNLIHLDLKWLEFLDYGTAENGESKHSFFKRFSEVCLRRSAADRSISDEAVKDLDIDCMTCGLALENTEGLSRVSYHFDVHSLGPVDVGLKGEYHMLGMILSPWTDSIEPSAVRSVEGIFYANWTPSTLTPSEIRDTGTRLDFVITESVYGYGFRDVTITMAFVVLFVHLTTVFVHLNITGLGTSWSSRAWTSLGEYFVLAMRSPVAPYMLENTGGGVKKLSKWKRRISVRELQGGRRVSLTVEDPGRPNSEDALNQITKVRPDWEYS